MVLMESYFFCASVRLGVLVICFAAAVSLSHSGFRQTDRRPYVSLSTAKEYRPHVGDLYRWNPVPF